MGIQSNSAHDVEHVYKAAKVKLADGTSTSTMELPLKNLGGIFSSELFARLLCLKYDFNNKVCKATAQELYECRQ